MRQIRCLTSLRWSTHATPAARPCGRRRSEMRWDVTGVTPGTANPRNRARCLVSSKDDSLMAFLSGNGDAGGRKRVLHRLLGLAMIFLGLAVVFLGLAVRLLGLAMLLARGLQLVMLV